MGKRIIYKGDIYILNKIVINKLKQIINKLFNIRLDKVIVIDMFIPNLSKFND